MTTPTLPTAASSVWTTGQTSHRAQRLGRYLPESAAHPARMLPAIARQAIATYAEPGELVLDPLCGIGTTLVEAVELGRNALGVELQPRWADLARANLADAPRRGATGTARVVTGDATQLHQLLPPLDRPVGLVLTSPPYGRSVHPRVPTSRTREATSARWHCAAPTPHRADLARLSQDRFATAMARLLAASASVLRPGGVVVCTARPWRRRGRLIDLPGVLRDAAEGAGLVLIDRVAALLTRLEDDHVVAHASLFQQTNVRAARQRGLPISVIAHEDVLVFQAGRTGRRS